MRDVRRVLSWVFLFTSLLCLVIAIWSSRWAFDRYQATSSPRFLAVPSIFSVMAVLYAMGWWAEFKKKPSAWLWGILASLTNVSLFLTLFVLRSRSGHGQAWITLAVGVMGIVAFASPRKKDPKPEGSTQDLIEPGDPDPEADPS